MRTTKIIWIEEDDDEELSSLALISSISFEDVAEASFIITDKGRILKNRNSPTYGLIVNNVSIPSFELVKQGKRKEKKRFRSIDEPTDINE